MQASIGCTGWGYAGWQGSFYPKGLKPSDFLKFYSSVFDLTEINSTFYAIPDPATAKRWNAQTPPHFRFTAKLPQKITHEKRLRGAAPDLEEFRESTRHLDSKYFLSVAQLPPSLSFEEARPHLEMLDSFFAERYVIEGRHPSWFSEPAVRYLSERNICLVWNDVDGVKNPLPLTSDFVYLRIIGDRQIPEKDFGRIVRNRDDDLKKWVQKLQDVRDRISLAAVLANNHYEGFGAATADKLRVLLGMEGLKWQNKLQKSLAEF